MNELFEGTTGRTVAESTPWWPAPVTPRPGAPNVIMVVLDDVGFAQLGCYGSAIATPHVDGLAADGVRYTNFHVTSLCSTTRASLLTGRNHHSVGVGFLADFDTGFPSYRGAVSRRAATLAEMLGAAGYGTYAIGKWHLTPPAQMSPAGPFHQWPTGRGFDRYYGFLWGEDDQWTPELWYDRHRVDPTTRNQPYHLSEDLVVRAEEFLSDHVSVAPERPFFCYLAFGACHAPHQAPREFIEKYRGAFDHGWDEERHRTLSRQLHSGIVPGGTQLAPLNPDVVAWDTLAADERRLYARMQEVFAGFMEHTDAQIGRLLEFLRRYGLLDNTLVMVLSDNGASGEGGPHGSANEYRYFLGLDDSFDDTLAAFDELGGMATHNHYPSGWAQAGNTPLKFYKKYTFGGGVRAPLVVHWPGWAEPGTLRPQFHHVIDVAPTVLEAAGVAVPEVYRGVQQLPVHGASMCYSLADAATPSRRSLQYFETAGHRGIYRDRLKAVTHHEPDTAFDDDRWELYALDSDFAETQDLAAERPDDVRSLVAAWWQEAERYAVLPLDDRMQTRALTLDPRTERSRYELLPGARMPNAVVGPNFSSRSFQISAYVRRDSNGDDGVLLAHGRRAAGFVLFVQGGRLVFDYNLAGDHTVVQTEPVVPLGSSMLQLMLGVDDGEVRARLLVDGVVHGEGELPQALPGGLGCLSTQCGHNSPSPVSSRYDAPFAFGGRLHKVIVELGDHVADVSRADWNAALAGD